MVSFPRQLRVSRGESFFLLGPRGTGKSTWVREAFPKAASFDLLDLKLYTELSIHPDRLEALVLPTRAKTVVLDEIQRIPQLLDEETG